MDIGEVSQALDLGDLLMGESLAEDRYLGFKKRIETFGVRLEIVAEAAKSWWLIGVNNGTQIRR